jgi:transposase-like protein
MQVVAEVDGGELIADVARRHRVQPRTLSWWRWKLRADGRAGARFLPVVVSSKAAPRDETPLELRIRDVVIRVATDTDVAYVAALVDALRG